MVPIRGGQRRTTRSRKPQSAGRRVIVEEGKHGQEMGWERGSGAAGRAAGKERERCREEVGREERNGRNRGRGEDTVRKRV